MRRGRSHAELTTKNHVLFSLNESAMALKMDLIREEDSSMC